MPANNAILKKKNVLLSKVFKNQPKNVFNFFVKENKIRKFIEINMKRFQIRD